MDDMKVDTSPSAKYLLPPAYDCPKLDWPESQRAALIAKMNERSHIEGWPYRLEYAENDRNTEAWHCLFADILSNLTRALADTNLRYICIPFMDVPEAERVAEHFDRVYFTDWQAGVWKGVKSAHWDDLIGHPILQKPPRRNVFTQESREDKARRLDQMFRTEYRGDAVKSFVRGIDIYGQIYDPERHYGRSIPILQSSATGKSRLVQELGTEVPTISVCFRKSTEPNAGWPPGDQPAYNFFKNYRKRQIRLPGSIFHTQFVPQGEELAAAFIGALMGVIARKLERRTAEGTSPKVWMKDWVLDTPTEVERSSRFQSFREVYAEAGTMLTTNMSVISNARVQSPSRAEKSPRTGRHYHEELYQILCLANAERLSRILSQQKCYKFVIAFDECSILNFHDPTLAQNDEGPNRGSSWDMSLIALQRIIKAGDRHDHHGVTIWYLLLDTSLSIFDLAPDRRDVPFSRLTDGLTRLPIWPYVGFNQMVDRTHAQGIRTAADVLTLEHLQVYGRPYWSGLGINEVVAAAEKKLFSTAFEPYDKNHVFAAFAVRIGLEIGEGDESEHLAREAVRNHMRILRRAHGQVVITESPSEPMLAIAAAVALNDSIQTYQTAVSTLVNRLSCDFVLDRGMQGELCIRLLFTLARDRAVQPFVKSRMVQAVSLSQFSCTLLGDDLGIRDGELRDSFLSRSSNIWIDFTHFVQLSEAVTELTTAYLLEAWSSGIAFQCAPLQPVMDGFLVCYIGKLGEQFDIGNLTVIPWQTKPRLQAALANLGAKLTAPSITNTVDGKTIRRKAPPLVICMDLGTSTPFQHNNGHVNLTFLAPTSPTKRTWDEYARDNEQEEPEQFCLNIRGHKSSTYRVMEHFNYELSTLFRRFLVCEDFAEFLDAMDEDMQRCVPGEE